MPFDEIPPEIIQRVFGLCCGSVAFTIPPPNETRPGTTQVTLSLVCSRWRAIALNTSALWNDVMVYYNATGEPAEGPTASFQFVQNWLNRAGMTPISLSISVYNALESEIAAISQALLSSFCITNLDLESDYSSYLIPTNNSSRLERLYLSSGRPAYRTRPFPRFPEMPSLKELRFSFNPKFFQGFENIYLIPWHQLRVLTLCDDIWPSQMLLNILQRCKSLVECNLLVNIQSGDEYNIVLPNMERLVLRIDSKRADPIIRSLTLPNLISLYITSAPIGLSLSPDAIEIMTQRSGFKRLTSFSLCQTEEPVDFRSLLGSMPALKRVQLFGPLMFLPGTFDDLSSGIIGDQLEEIRFGDMSDEEIGQVLETIGRRHEKAKTVSDLRPFASVTCGTSGSELESHTQRAKQCSEAFNTDVAIVTPSTIANWELQKFFQMVNRETSPAPFSN